MAGENGTLSYTGSSAGKVSLKSFKVKITRILFGLNIIGEEDHSQGGTKYNGGYAGRVFYNRQFFQSTFSITVALSTWEDRVDFVGWCIAYMQFVSNPYNGVGTTPMRVRGPRGFDFSGVLTEGPELNNSVDDLVYVENLVFRGSQPTRNGAVYAAPSTYTKAPNNPDSKYFYPAAGDFQVGQSADAFLYGNNV